MRYFPIFMDISEKPVLVVGGGEVASRKVEALIKANAKITIVSPTVSDTLKSLIECQKCEWIHEKYDKNQLSNDLVQVWATTNDSDLNHKIYHDAHQLNLLVNVVDDQPYCDFITPSMINRGRIQLAISSGGASPVLIRNVRQALEGVLPQNLALLAEFAASKRDHIKQVLTSVDLRRRFWERFFADPKVKEADTWATLEECYLHSLQTNDILTPDCTFIYYGDDVELLPMKATRYMQQSDLVLFDTTCGDEYIELSRRDAEKRCFETIEQLKSLLSDAHQQQSRVTVFVCQTKKSLYEGHFEINRSFSIAAMKSNF
jgi:precorrin-2 dehydrogenase/sirohydrochlorin ferrochelatase